MAEQCLICDGDFTRLDWDKHFYLLECHLDCVASFRNSRIKEVCPSCWEKVFINHDVDDFFFALYGLKSFKKIASDPTSPRNGW
jgi:hypothetical protein